MKHYDHPAKPSRFLVENLALLTPGKTLDVAMGAGRNAVYLAQQGFSVTGVDIAPDSVAQALENAREAGTSIQAVVGDLENGGYRIQPDTWDLIICFNYLHRPLIPSMRNGVRPGGMIVYETYIMYQQQFGRPHNPDFLLAYNELLDMFRDFRVLRYHEGIMEPEKAVAGIIAVKPGI